MSRRQAILETLLIFAVFCLQGAWPVPEVNEPYYLGKAIHYWNPHWASSDWFLQTADTHAVFYFSVGWLALILKPTAFAWTVRLLTWALLAWSWQRLSRAVVPRAWASVLTATLFVFLLQHYNMAGEWVVGGAEAKGFSFVLVFLALEAMVEGYWNRMWLLLGVASAFHILVGGWAAVAAGAVWMLRSGTAPALRRQFPTASNPAQRPFDSGSCFLLDRAAGRLPPGLARSRAGAADESRSGSGRGGPGPPDLCLRTVSPSPRSGEVLGRWFRAAVSLDRRPRGCCCGRRASDSPGARRLRGFTAAAVVIALIGAAISLLSLYDRRLAAGWMRFYWYRLVDVAVPLGLALLSVRWFVERKMRVALALVTAVAAFHAVDCVVLKLFSDPPFAERQVDGTAWRSACLWATGQGEGGRCFPGNRGRTSCETTATGSMSAAGFRTRSTLRRTPDSSFPAPAFTFKWYAGRGEVVNWKETPQDAASLVDWWKRIQDIYATGNPPPQEKYYMSLADAGAPKLQELAKKYEADYLVTQVSRADVAAAGTCIRIESFVVYKMR